MANSKPSKQDIVTVVIAAVAVLMAVVVVLLKTGVLEKNEEVTDPETEIKTEIVLVSETKDDGEVVYYTMLNTYVKPKISSNHIYPTTAPPPTTEPETELFYEYESVICLSDENGNPLYDENGEPVTQKITYTVPITEEGETEETETTTEYVPKTSSIAVTNKLHIQKKDENGNPLTQIVVLDSDPAPVVTQVQTLEQTTAAPVTENPSFGRDDEAASAIVSKVNELRAAKGLSALEVDSSLNAAARSNSMGKADPKNYSTVSGYPKLKFLSTTFGGDGLASSVVNSGVGTEGASEYNTKIGVGIVKYEGVYYTTVIFK